MRLTDQSAEYTNINNHLWLCKYIGSASAPAIFQRAIDDILSGIPGVTCYIDDILATGVTDAENLSRLKMVFEKPREYILRLQNDKCGHL